MKQQQNQRQEAETQTFPGASSGSVEPVPGRVQPRATAHRPSLTTTGLPAPTCDHPSELWHRHSLNLLVWYVKTPHILIASHICGEMASMSKIILYLSKCIHMNTCWYFRSLLLMTNREGWWKSKTHLLSFEGLGPKKKKKRGSGFLHGDFPVFVYVHGFPVDR